MPAFATNFNDSMIPRINEVLKFVLENENSDFYRKKYGKKPEFYPIKSYEDFKKIPFLTKDEIIDIEWKKRIFIPENEVASFTFSSGTTNAKKPLLMPRGDDSHYRKELEYEKNIMIEAGAKIIMTLYSPMSPGSRYSDKQAKGIITIPGDIQKLELSARIAKDVAIQGIRTSPTVLDLFTNHLKEIGFDFLQIKWIYLGGEFCSFERASLYKSIFPNAKLNFRFRTSEIGGARGWRCAIMEESSFPSIFHLSKSSLVEVLDEKNTVLPLDESGELLHTDLIKKAFPLIRYKTDDFGSLSQKDCQCGEKYYLSVGGKIGIDVIRLYGSILRTDMIEKTLKKIEDYATLNYEAHLYEDRVGNKMKPRLKLILEAKPGNDTENIKVLELISQKISSNLKLSAGKTLKDLVEMGIFMPLEIEFSKNRPLANYKSKKIISHLD